MSADDLRQMNARHTRTVERQQQSIDRRMNDQRMVDLLAQDDFKGKRYDQFANELIRYGISVLRGWMHSGFIFDLVARRGYGLSPTSFELDELASDNDLREQLASMTVACTLPRFRQRALVEGGWTQAGGASIATYFMGSCTYDFPNEFRRHRSERERWRRSTQRQREIREHWVGASAAEEVMETLEALDVLHSIAASRDRAIVLLTSEGFSQEEICSLVDARSARAVEGALYRLRKQMKQSRREDGE
ncbi:hypothetical protein [Streptomyces yangpuensis]|uniref:hypothetical protein n=1 Tax=Streptomyces yangpuensis TaxID=1648182 RepID=UPI0036693C24